MKNILLLLLTSIVLGKSAYAQSTFEWRTPQKTNDTLLWSKVSNSPIYGYEFSLDSILNATITGSSYYSMWYNAKDSALYFIVDLNCKIGPDEIFVKIEGFINNGKKFFFSTLGDDGFYDRTKVKFVKNELHITSAIIEFPQVTWHESKDGIDTQNEFRVPGEFKTWLKSEYGASGKINLLDWAYPAADYRTVQYYIFNKMNDPETCWGQWAMMWQKEPGYKPFFGTKHFVTCAEK